MVRSIGTVRLGALLAIAAFIVTPVTAAVLAAEAEGTRKVVVQGGGRYTDVSAAALAAMMKQKDFRLINVHIPYQGEIAGTDLLVPYNAIEANAGKLPADRGATVVLYCSSGRMSAIATGTLLRLGYTNVWNLSGGMSAWKDAGQPIVNIHR